MKNSLYQDDSDSSNDIIYDEDCVESCDCQGICSCLSELDFYDKDECLDCADDCCGDEDCHSRDQEPELADDKE